MTKELLVIAPWHGVLKMAPKPKTTPAINRLEEGIYKPHCSHVRRSTVKRRVSHIFKTRFYPLLDLKQRHNTTVGRKNKILDAVLHAAITNDFIENGTNILRHSKKHIPSPRTVRHHLGKLKVEEVTVMFNMLFEVICKEAKKRGFLKGKVDVAIDITDWLFYGDSDTEMVVGTQPKRGTHWAYKFITLNIVEKGVRFTLKALPINDYSEINKLLKELIVFAKEKVDINIVYLDKGFYEVEVANMLKRLGVHFIIHAKLQGERIKKLIAANEDKEAIAVNYKMIRKRAPRSTADVKLFIVPHRMKKGQKTGFITDLDVTEDTAKDYAEAFRKRWGIETSYRVKNNFRPKTTSRNFAIRLFFFLFSVCFYNLWVLTSIVIGEVLGIIVDKPLITAKMFGTMIITAYDGDGNGG